ncbi:MAG TPA: LysM peptidoglycan-binding domain-containing protein [Clostridiaceae bacterium]|nr:LysM peptidoglycan-binding domain-containing protein [Clostridiaceae bacterium]
MAKASAPTSTRLVATINARYYPVEGVADAYCLNGRFPSKRELRSVNTTLDHDSKGSFVALFGYSSDGQAPVSGWQESLTRLVGQVNSDRGDIDNDINDLAETAMDVTGRIKLREDAAREPYFSGVIIRDGEIAAVTVGDSLAFIYRYEALYPLTSSLKKLEPTDLYGDRVEGFEDFIAGEAGTIRYSNIAQIEQGDRLILCNSEVFDSIGQSQMMRYLQEAEDSLDAASLLLTAAASQMPGTPMQVAVADVISIKEDDSTAARFSLGRFATQAMEPVVEPVQESPDVDLARTQRYQRQDMVDTMKAAPAMEKPASPDDRWARDYSADPERKSPFAYEKPAEPAPSDREPLFSPYRNFVEAPTSAPRSPIEDGDVFADYKEESERPSDLPVFAYSSEAQRRRSAQYDDFRQQEVWNAGDESNDDRHYDPYSDDDYDELGYERRPRASDSRRRLVFYIILISIIIVSLVALIKLLAGGGSSSPSDETTTTLSSQTDPIVAPDTTTIPTDPSAPSKSTTTTAPPATGDTIYKVKKAGEDLASISSSFKRIYPNGLNERGLKKLARYNNIDDYRKVLSVGQEIKLPPLQTLKDMPNE